MRHVAIFDLDGTLVDSRTDLVTAGNHARVAVGLSRLPTDEVLGFVGDGLDRLIERLIPQTSQRVAAKSVFMEFYLAHCCDQTHPYDGILPVLKALTAQGWAIAVATNKPGLFTQPILLGTGIAPFCACVRAGDGPRKPAPGQLLDIMTSLAVRPDNCWMIGDHHTDIRAGQAAACRVAFCEWGIGNCDGLVVDLRVQHPHDLLRIVDL